jgi:tRNA (guanine26-N2/guanine27-N2)-dimethyltransferase
LSFGFPTETITEGRVKVVVPKLAAYVKKPWEYAPSKAPVFYNPAMELNRDFAVLTLQSYQRKLGREVSVCEPLTGCGLRGVRFAVEVEGVGRVALNDISSKAAELASFNAEINNVECTVKVANEDANLFLSRHAAPRKRFHYVDVDPFGSPVPYLDAALRVLRSGGLLALTATDMAPLCGVHPRACLRKYGGYPLRTEYCHELAVRLLVGSLVMVAAKHEISVEVLFSHSFDHYVRAYAAVNHGARRADKSVEKMGYILHCFSCFHRETCRGIISPLKRVCPNCKAKLSFAGPLWLGKIADRSFSSLIEKEAEKRNLRQKKRLLKMTSLVKDEAKAPITYYTVDVICDKLNLPIPALKEVINQVKKEGFQVVRTHFNSQGFRTNAPANLVKQVIADLVTKET